VARSRYILILAKNAKQAVTYAKRAGLPNFSYRCVASAGSVTGITSADVHILPEFHTRPDRHRIFAALRYSRDIDYYDVEMPDLLEAPAVDQGDGMGEQLSIDDVLEEDQHMARLGLLPEVEKELGPGAVDPLDDVTAPEEEGVDFVLGADPAELGIEDKPKPRRKRCKVCGRLTVGDYPDDDTHDAAAHKPGAGADVQNIWDD
jgi:hypothetical protein